MSLINDALKKAQRERSQAPEHPATIAPAVPPPPATHGAAPHGELRAKGNPWPVLLIVLALVAGGGAVWFLKPSGRPATAPAPQFAANSQAPATPTPPPAAEPAVQLQFNAPAQPTVPTPAPSAPAPQPVATNLPPTPPAAVAPPQQPPAAPAIAIVPAAPAPIPAPTAVTQQLAPAAPEPLKINLQVEDPRILAFLDTARIQGIRSVADDPKLLMNNKVYRTGAVVDRELGLKLIQILPTELVFEDPHGIQYRKLL